MLVDARAGIIEQSRRHAYLAALLGIRHVVACVNKMDLVEWDESRFREIEAGFVEMAGRLGVPDTRVIPVSALNGDNVVDASAHTPWFTDLPLLAQLERLEASRSRRASPCSSRCARPTTGATPAASPAGCSARATRSW